MGVKSRVVYRQNHGLILRNHVSDFTVTGRIWPRLAAPANRNSASIVEEPWPLSIPLFGAAMVKGSKSLMLTLAGVHGTSTLVALLRGQWREEACRTSSTMKLAVVGSRFTERRLNQRGKVVCC